MPPTADDGIEEWNPDGSDEHWDDPQWVAELRARFEAEGMAEDPEWEQAQTQEQLDWHWKAALKLFGI